MDHVNVGVIGTGWMGQLHARVLSQLPQARLVAVADAQADRARAAAALADDCSAYDGYQDLLADPRVQAVSICTPDTLHRAPVEAAARAGKHVFLEKPIASTLDDADAIIEACRAAGVRLGIGFLLRFDPRFRRVKDLLEDGTLGEPIHVYARRNSPRDVGPARYGGTIPLALHVTSHDVDLILWYLRPRRPVSVYAQDTAKLLGELGTTDTILSIVRFDDDTLVSFESSWALPEASRTRIDARLEIVCSEGVAEVECAESGVYLATRSTVDYPDTHHWPEVGGRLAGDLREELAGFADAVIGDRAPAVTGEDGRAALELVLAMMRSAETGQVERL
jgi:myo-inositol 2-dehydrogenase/D-chiro-inositol 1-dehydrogenase/UDP-N-acetylglucosamine 3-dehydrogenase